MPTGVSYELKKAAIMDVEIWINKAYYSLLKSHLAAQISTVSYAEYFVNSSENRFGLSTSFRNGATLNALLP